MQGSGLARAPSVWYVDHRDDDAASGASQNSPARAPSPAASAPSPAPPTTSSASTRDARGCHRALAHPESREHDHLRDELARHVAAGGATVLVTPIVDPLIVDLSADAERDARATFDGDGDGYGSFARAPPAPSTLTDHPPPRDRRAASSSRAPCGARPERPGRLLRERTRTYCTSCPVLASCDVDGLGAALVPPSAEHGAGETRRAAGAGSCETAGALGIARSRAPSKRRRRRWRRGTCTTPPSCRRRAEWGWRRRMLSKRRRARRRRLSVGYEEFLVYRPAGDAWIAGSVPPPTSVRRASFGPKLRRELATLSAERRPRDAAAQL